MQESPLNSSTYSKFLVLLTCSLSFLAGIFFELYATSLPHFAAFFGVTETYIKNTITVSVIGYALGSLLFGVFADFFDKKRVLVISLCVFLALSLLTTQITQSFELMLIRFIQGIFISAAAIYSRSIVSHHFSGNKFTIVVLYTSIAYSLGLLSAPPLGGYLQYFIGWQSVFYAYALISALIVVALQIAYHNNTTTQSLPAFSHVIMAFKEILASRVFWGASAISGLIVVVLLVYPTFGIFIVNDLLGYSLLDYGNSAMLLGFSFLAGSLSNRLLMKYFTQQKIIKIGFMLFSIAVLAQITLSFLNIFSLNAVLLPIALIVYSTGFVHGHMLALSLSLYPEWAGISAALQACLVMSIGAAGVFLLSFFSFQTMQNISVVFLCLLLLKMGFYNAIVKQKLLSNA